MIYFIHYFLLNLLMKILYIGVHYFKNQENWRTESFIDFSFNKHNIDTVKIDYRQILSKKSTTELAKLIYDKSLCVDAIFLQRGDNLSPDIFSKVRIPIIFWSTEPINLKNDVDLLLESNIFSWVFVHTYSCLHRIDNEFPHLKKISSVVHNAIPSDKIKIDESKKKYFAIFNRNLSLRRKWWLWPSRKYIKIIKGRFGDSYYTDLSNAKVSVNIHFTSKNLDDFETGIFEAMASGCVVVSEALDPKTVEDLFMNDAIIQVNSRKELKSKLKYLNLNPNLLDQYKKKTKVAISKNTWFHRVEIFKKKIEDILSK